MYPTNSHPVHRYPFLWTGLEVFADLVSLSVQLDIFNALT